MIPFSRILRIGKSTEAKSRLEVAGNWEEWGVLANGLRVFKGWWTCFGTDSEDRHTTL